MLTPLRTFVPSCLQAFLCLLLPLHAIAQVPAPPNQPPPNILNRIGFDQNLGTTIPLDLTFRDEAGNPVTLHQYFGQKPVVLAFVYYQCPSLCTMSLNGMLAAFKAMRLDVGRDFTVVTVSFDPRETPALAAAKKKSYLRQYPRPNAEQGWHFLTGDQPAIQALTQACGFRYYYDEKTQQYAHASGIIVLTPQGKLSHYFYGLELSPKDVQLGLVEASSGKIGSLADKVLLLCYQYDPTSGRYGFVIMSALRIAGILTLIAIASFIVLSIRRDRRKAQVAADGKATLNPNPSNPHA